MNKTNISWCDATWNPIVGCTKCSPACEHCYAEALHTMRYSAYWAGKKALPRQYAKPFSEMQFLPERLAQITPRQKPQRIFVCSMSDLFHEDVWSSWIKDIVERMALCRQHTFLLLTKRYGDMRGFCEGWMHVEGKTLPPNLWLGATAWDQASFDAAWKELSQIPAAHRFISLEPLLGPVDVGLCKTTCSCCERRPGRWIRLRRPIGPDLPFLLKNPENSVADCGIYRADSNRHGALTVKTPAGALGIKPSECEFLAVPDWVIVGGETGPRARPMHPQWVRDIRDQCQAAGVAFHLKQMGEWEYGCTYYDEDDDVREVHLNRDHVLLCRNPNGTFYKWDIDRDGQPIGTCEIWHRVGRARAGHLLDGKEWREFPEGLAIKKGGE